MGTESVIDGCVERLRVRGVPFESIEGAPWVAEIESRLGFPFSGSFRALITRYRFPLLELKSVELFSNQGDGSEYDLSAAPFRDRFMSPWLAAHRLIHVGFPHIGNYDPICLDLRTARDPAVIQLDHEAILMNRPKVRETVLARTFIDLMVREADV